MADFERKSAIGVHVTEVMRTKWNINNMDFLSDLTQAIVSEFTERGISFPECADPAHLASRYFEMRIRRIEPIPRQVYLSKEIHGSLGDLARNNDPQRRQKALEARSTVFYLRHLFVSGGSVMPHLTDRVNHTEKSDWLLWDYAIHHLHLSRNIRENGFVERSGWLLFAIVADQDVFFVDVRPHRQTDGLQWVRQDLLDIVHSNWPELTESRSLRGVIGTTVTDIEKLELRRKNANLAHAVEGQAIAPLGLGTTADGHSALCRFLAYTLLRELKQHQICLYSLTDELRAVFIEKGMPEDARMDFKLVRRGELNITGYPSAVESFSRDLWLIGFAIIETNTRSPIIV